MCVRKQPHIEIKNLLDSLSNDLKSGDKHTWILNNLLRDLKAIERRMKSGEYADTDFENRNSFDIPRRTREFFRYFRGYMRQAQTWKVLLKNLPMNSFPSLINICPGWAPKIELALHLSGYEGQVILFDKNQDSLTSLMDFLEFFEPRFTLKTVLSDVYSLPKPTAKLVIGNHILDDLLLNKFCQDHNLILEDVYESESTYKEIIQKIMTRKLSKEFIAETAQALQAFCEPGATLILTQYPALAETDLTLTDWTRFCHDFLLALKAIFLQLGAVDEGTTVLKGLETQTAKYFSAEHAIVLKTSPYRQQLDL